MNFRPSLHTLFLLASIGWMGLLSGTVAGQTTFSGENIIFDDADGATGVFCHDLDGDGDTDVVSANYTDDKIAWYPNDGNGNFEGEIIISGDADGARAVFCHDLDGDGDIDVVSASEFDDKIAWYPNEGNGSFGGEIIISEDAVGAHDVFCHDLDGDGDIDVVSADYFDDKIAWYPNDGNGNFEGEIIISGDADGARAVFCHDLDGDGDIDVVWAGAIEKLAWHANDGNGNFGGEIIVSEDAWGAAAVFCHDLDGDGDIDLVSASEFDDKIAWYPNEGNGSFGEQIIISDDADYATRVFCQDLDGDGDIDVVSVSWGDDKIAWYPNEGNGNFGEQIIISEDADGVRGVFCHDLDGDGDMDVVSAITYADKIAWYENQLGEGCTDSDACNYDPEAWIDNSSCCYGICGCTDASAANFLPEAECDIGSCLYALTGVVFDDLNEDGTFAEDEYPLPFQQVYISELGTLLLTNDEGAFSTLVPAGEYTLTVGYNPNLPYNTTPSSVGFSTAESLFVEFGLSKEAPVYEVCIDFYPSGNSFLCNDWSNHNICFRNTGNVPIDGVLALEIDEMFQGWQEVTPIDSTDGNTVYMSFEGLQPGVMYMYDILLNTPTVDFIGETAVSTASIEGYNSEGMLVATGTQTLHTEILCAYDPNDKQAFPLGYGDDHRLLPGTEQEFLVRFQNTGNAPAQDVVIADTLDVNFDLETFELVANSHSMSAVINEVTREVRFQFFDIQLPDSTCCEPESHGLVSYTIRPLPGLEPETRLENTAYIYFDNNEPIVTNTTWTTIHGCQDTVNILTSTEPECPTALVEVHTDYIFYSGLDTEFYWTGDQDVSGSEPTLLLSGTYPGQVQLTTNNPLCTNFTSKTWTQEELDNYWLTCPADVDCNGVIGISDITAFLAQFSCDGDCSFELTGDGKVDSEDLLEVLSVFGTLCP